MSLSQLSEKELAVRKIKAVDSLKSRERIFLENNFEVLDSDTKQALQAGSLQLAEGDLYVKRLINISGSTDVLDSTTVIQGGLCKFDRTKVVELQNFVLSSIRLGYGNHATETNPANIAYSNLRADVPAALQNADFIITANDTPIFEARFARFLTGAASDKTQGQEDAVRLKTMKLLTPTMVLGMTVKVPQGLTLDPAKKHFIEVVFMGEYTRVGVNLK